jgi:hypothetical protein
MRHLENSPLKKFLVLYWFVNLKVFHPECRNFDQTDTIFLNTEETFLFSIFEIVVFFQSQPCLDSGLTVHILLGIAKSCHTLTHFVIEINLLFKKDNLQNKIFKNNFNLI